MGRIFLKKNYAIIKMNSFIKLFPIVLIGLRHGSFCIGAKQANPLGLLDMRRQTSCFIVEHADLHVDRCLSQAEQKNEKVQQISLIPRGGSSASTSLSLSLVRTVRKVSPLLANILSSFFKLIEKILGIRLLPRTDMEIDSRKLKIKAQKAKSPRKKHKREKESDNSTNSVKSDDESNQPALKSKSDRKDGTKSATNTGTQHLEKELKATNPNHRIQRELKEFLKSPPPNLKVNVGKNIRIWIITMTGAQGTIYEGEVYKLRVSFPDRYPIVPPSVYFLKPTPRHEHVYTNGDICLSLLGKDWRPTMTAQSIAVSILSILSSARKKSLPMDNSRVASLKPGQSQENWVYHDDNC